jgi:hypothetical protein
LAVFLAKESTPTPVNAVFWYELSGNINWLLEKFQEFCSLPSVPVEILTTSYLF